MQNSLRRIRVAGVMLGLFFLSEPAFTYSQEELVSEDKTEPETLISQDAADQTQEEKLESDVSFGDTIVATEEGLLEPVVNDVLITKERTDSEVEKVSADVTITTDKTEYAAEISIDQSSGIVLGEAVKVTVTNKLKNDIFINPHGAMPFATLYFEIYKDQQWQVYQQVHEIAEYSPGFTFQRWLEKAKRIKSEDKSVAVKQVRYATDVDLFKGKYRLKLEYFIMPVMPETDYTAVDYLVYREANFRTACTDEFLIK